MSKSRKQKDAKSLSATPPLLQDNALTSVDEMDAPATTVCPPSTLNPSLTPPIPADDMKPDVDAAMSCDMSPKPSAPVSSGKKQQSAPPQLISNLPRAEKEALSVFTEIECNHYQYGTLGLSRELLESMTCDCQYDPAVNSPDDACGHDSDCINRLTQVECLPDDCRCRSYCQNQRFQRKEYADIEIVQTEKKGFGLRAAADLQKDTFIYEYVGDVVSQPSFQKRMRDYAAEGIRHFYFMMLQKDEFIDATKRGGIGRFANHSCSPNCYVAKWTIGRHVRMGIFANRTIKKHEELTFNYNVDRYGHEAQPCYCGEPNCVGFIGGKTQTELAGMDDLYLDALGITEEVDRLGLKGNKRRRGKKLDDPDFAPILKPLVLKDVPKVVQAIRQTQSRKVLFKLLTRIKITEDLPALRQIMRLRGFSLMTNILEDHAGDIEINIAALECMSNWPLLQRNKVDDSKVNVPVEVCAKSNNETIKTLAQKLLDHWLTLESAYRIPKRAIGQDDDDITQTSASITITEDDHTDSPPQKRSKFIEPSLKIRPLGFSAVPTIVPQEKGPDPYETRLVRLRAVETSRQSVAAIIAAATAAAAAAAVTATVLADPSTTVEEDMSRKKPKSPKKHQTKEEKEANKEKRLLKLVGAVVVKCMSKYQKDMDHDMFKKHAKELTQVIAEKEKKSSSYKDGNLDSLSDEKVAKIKKFAKEYINKILRKLEASGKRHRPPSTPATQAASSTTMNTPDSHDCVSANGADVIMAEVTVGETMDLNSDSDMEDGPNDNDNNDEDPRGSTEVSPLEALFPPNDGQTDSVQKVSIFTSDPRRRRPSEDQDLSNGWDPDEHRSNGLVVSNNGWTAES